MSSVPQSLPQTPASAIEEYVASTDDADVEKRMSEQQLRELYDSEEIDRFLSLFSAYVTEVQLHDTVRARMDPTSSTAAAPNLLQPENIDWTSNDSPLISRPSTPPPVLPLDRSISEEIALRYLLPILPTSSPPVPLFTLGRLRLTTQRLYLAIQPVYGPFFASLIKLATWKDRRKSLFYCIVFWSLWYQNLLLPCLFLRILYALARRRLLSYPTLAELRDHREEIERAAEFGQELSTRFSASSVLGVKELWRIFKVFNKPKRAKVKKVAREKTRAHPPQDPLSDDQISEQEVNTVLDSEDENAQENDIKRAVLQALAELADFHERVKNIFIWRRPASSRIYGLVLTLLFILTLVMPAQYLAKLACFIGGFLFWHAAPIIAALPPGAQLPPALADVPTDAEYAMELISQRVAAGLPIQPVGPQRAKASDNKKRDEDGKHSEAASQSQSQTKDKEVDWKKWGERAAVGMSWVEDGKRMFTGGQRPQNTNRLTPHESVETHTFPAQHVSAPGLITLTAATLYFTPLMVSTAKLEIPLANLRGVKKRSGLFTALTMVWEDEQVKQEIFMTDVSNCVASLKKVVQQMQSLSSGEDLQMAQPAARPSAVTLAKDPGAAYHIDFDALVADWDEYLNIGDKNKPEEVESEDEFDPKAKSKKSSRKNKAPQPAEEPRADQYTLNEHHDHLLSNSFNLSFNGSSGDPSSSQHGGGFVLDDIFLAAPDGLDIGEGLGDDLAKELGEGWGVFTDNANDMQIDNPVNEYGDIPMDLDLGGDVAFDAGPPEEPPRDASESDRDKENMPPSTLRRTNSNPVAFSPATSFSRLLLSQDEEPQVPLVDVTADEQNQKNVGPKKIKKTRLLLDARTELTDDELKAARAQYLKGQAILRRGLDQKRVEKDGGKFIEDLLWGVPRGVQAESLVEFWQENFKVQVEARTGVVVLHPAEEPPKKRRKIRNIPDIIEEVPQDFANDMREEVFDQDFNMQDIDPGIGVQMNIPKFPEKSRGQSSGAPQRNLDKPAMYLAHHPSWGAISISLHKVQLQDLREAPSFHGIMLVGAHPAPLGSVRWAAIAESSLVPSQSGSVLSALEFSPGVGKKAQALGEDYEFDVDTQPPNPSAMDSQRSDMNLITLERNSFNFLEYVRMQLQSLPGSVSDLSFDAVVPMATSTRHVAAAAFYHCLVLATKDLLHVKQPEAYGALSITIA
ncbi:RNA cytidine acetyltransferase [Mycena sanguinolenta]|uniref:RNA cytidine acetyltransferase n=1 Tax=Mycena sanguinolenta TaxID=230812 RepID=A0A8H6XE92_9AGAR|nr:RNA cytidine acetyltransferase [Mycena sanguinolenta]